MLKRKITYPDFEGEERTEECRFNLSKAELTAMNFEELGGLDKRIQIIVDAKDQKSIMEVFKDLLLRSYGEQSPDGKYFTKNDKIRERFESSPMYDIMYMELATDAEAGAKFIEAVVPKGMVTMNANPTS